MCATDLDLELEIIEGEQALDPGSQPASSLASCARQARSTRASGSKATRMAG